MSLERSPTEQYSNQGSAKYSKSSKDTTNKNNEMPKDFLDALRFLREEIMEAMDNKLAILLSNQNYTSTVRPPGSACSHQSNMQRCRQEQACMP